MSESMTRRVAILTGPEQVEVREERMNPAGPGEVIVEIEAATTCGTDVKVFRRGGHPRMLVVPSPFGHEFSGTISALGEGVSGWREGDAVVVANSAPCGHCAPCRVQKENLCVDLHYLNGAYAERIVIPSRFVERSLYRRPGTLHAGIAALTEPLACVVHGAETVDLRPESDVVLFGGGPIGLLFVALLASEGHRVVMCDPHPGRLEAARDLGATAGVSAQRNEEDQARVRALAADPAGYTLAIEATGAPAGWTNAIGSVRPGGSVLLFGGCAPGSTVPLDTHLLHYSEIAVRGAYHHRPSTFARALALLASGQIDGSRLLSEERPLHEVETALRGMMEKRILKAVIRP